MHKTTYSQYLSTDVIYYEHKNHHHYKHFHASLPLWSVRNTIGWRLLLANLLGVTMHSHNSENVKPTDSCTVWHTLSLNKIQGFFDKEFDWFYLMIVLWKCSVKTWCICDHRDVIVFTKFPYFVAFHKITDSSVTNTCHDSTAFFFIYIFPWVSSTRVFFSPISSEFFIHFSRHS